MTVQYHKLSDLEVAGKPGRSSRLDLTWGFFGFIAGFSSCFLLGLGFAWLHNWDGLPSRCAGSPSMIRDVSEIYVDLPQGRVRGTRTVSGSGAAATAPGRAFLGIPYGRANRWELPRPAAPWHPGVLDATTFGTSCVRPQASNTSNMGEDCLHLNVFLPPPTQGQTDKGHAVLVWLHGGSFLYGSADDTHATNLRELVLSNQLIVVTVEHRLGILGFLASHRLLPAGSSGPRGNLGILDQQLALKWVNQHIAYFSGDANRITLLGWSAGAASVSAHLTMPSSQGLFQHALMLSGGFVSWAAQSAEAAESSYDVILKAAGCGESQECLEEGPPCSCLMELNCSQVIDLDRQYFAAPTVDGTVLPHHPMDALRLQKISSNVPIIIGTAIEDSFVDIGASAGSAEFKAYLEAVLPNKSKIDEAYSLYMDSPSEQNILKGGNLPVHRGFSRFYWAARRVYADSVMTCPARRVAAQWQKTTGQLAFWYLWGVGRDATAPQLPVGPGRVYHPKKLRLSTCWPCPGAGHGADLDYFFDGMGHRIQNQAESLSTTYPALLADFAKHGDPNRWNGFTLHANRSFAWPSAQDGGMWFQINQSRFSPQLRAEVCSFWDSLQ